MSNTNPDPKNSATRPRVLLDCDGVLSDFVGAYLETVFIVTGRRYNREQVTGFDIALSLALSPDEKALCNRTLTTQPGWCESLKVYPGAVEAIDRLRGFADVVTVTAPWDTSPTWMHERTWWLVKHLGFKASEVIHAHAKHVCRGDVFVDDRVSTCIEWQQHNPDGLAVIWDTPHNQRGSWDGCARTNSWDALIRIVTTKESRRG